MAGAPCDVVPACAGVPCCAVAASPYIPALGCFGTIATLACGVGVEQTVCDAEPPGCVSFTIGDVTTSYRIEPGVPDGKVPGAAPCAEVVANAPSCDALGASGTAGAGGGGAGASGTAGAGGGGAGASGTAGAGGSGAGAAGQGGAGG